MIDRTPQIMDIDSFGRYSVVIPLIKTESGYEVLFEVRSSKLRRQPGEICFPGGRSEDGETPWQTAARETCEELLITKNQFAQVIPLDIFVSPFNMVIYPFAAVLENYDDSKSDDEVAEVFTVPLDFFKNHSPKCYVCRVDNCPQEDFPFDKIPYGRDYPWRQGRYEVIFYAYEKRNIWGLTAKLLRASLPLLDILIKSLEDKKDEKEKKQTDDYGR